MDKESLLKRIAANESLSTLLTEYYDIGYADGAEGIRGDEGRQWIAEDKHREIRWAIQDRIDAALLKAIDIYINPVVDAADKGLCWETYFELAVKAGYETISEGEYARMVEIIKFKKNFESWQRPYGDTAVLSR